MTEPVRRREVSDERVVLAWRPTPADEIAARARVGRLRRGGAALAMGVALSGVLRAAVDLEGAARTLALAAAVALGAFAARALWLAPRRVGDGREAALQHLEAGREGVRHTVGGRRTTYAWSAVRRVTVGRRHVFLHLASAEVLTIPRRAFGPEPEERRALEALRAWHRRPGPTVRPPERMGDGAVYALRYVLRPQDFAAFVQALRRRDLRVRPLWVLAGTGLLSALLVGGPVSEGGFDRASLVLAGGFAATFGLLGLAPWWMPRLFTPLVVRAALKLDPARLPAGDVDLRVGPEGGWSSSSRGVSRFDWADVEGVLEGEGVVVLLFGPLTGVIVPDRALGERRDAFVAQCRAWLGAPHAGPSRSLRPPGPPPDPFAPPRHGL